MPTDSKARVEGETATDQRDGDIDVVAKPSKNHGGTAKDIGVVTGDTSARRARFKPSRRFACQSSAQPPMSS